MGLGNERYSAVVWLPYRSAMGMFSELRARGMPALVRPRARATRAHTRACTCASKCAQAPTPTLAPTQVPSPNFLARLILHSNYTFFDLTKSEASVHLTPQSGHGARLAELGSHPWQSVKDPLLLERWVARAVYYSLHHTVLFNSWQDLADLLMTFDFDTNSKEVLSQNSADVQAIARSWAAVFVDIARLQQPLMGM